MRNKMMKEFDIHLLSIKNDVKEFEFQLSDSFFEEFEQDLIESGDLTAKVNVTKTHSMITVDVDIKGELEYVCDRSLEKFKEPFHLSTTWFFKYGEEDMELDIDLYQIKENTITINLADYLMECILVELPIKKIHPKYRGNEDIEEGEPFFQTEINGEEEGTDIDPRWEKLKNLKK